jgi:hypothetical protein
MDHIVLDNGLGVVILRRVKDDISRLHLFLRQDNWKCVKLVALIARPQPKSELLPQVIDSFPYKGTAV